MPDNDFECKQIFIAHESLWKAMQQWAANHDFRLDLIPHFNEDGTMTLTYPEGETPTYAFMPKDVPR